MEFFIFYYIFFADIFLVLKEANLDKNEVNEIVLVGGSTKIPKIQSLIRNFFNNKELNNIINPEEVIAVGAAIQGDLLNFRIEEKGLFDLLPISYGIETNGG